MFGRRKTEEVAAHHRRLHGHLLGRSLLALAAIVVSVRLIDRCACRHRADDDDGGERRSRERRQAVGGTGTGSLTAAPVTPPSGDKVLKFGAAAPPVEPKRDAW